MSKLDTKHSDTRTKHEEVSVGTGIDIKESKVKLANKVGNTDLRIRTGPEKEHEKEESKSVNMVTFGKEMDIEKGLDGNLTGQGEENLILGEDVDSDITQDIGNKNDTTLYEDNYVKKLEKPEFKESTIAKEKEEKKDWNDLIDE